MIDWLRRPPLEPAVELEGRTLPIVLRRMRHARRLTLRLRLRPPLLRRKAQPRLKPVTITHVKMSPDLSHAWVYFELLTGDAHDPLQQEILEARKAVDAIHVAEPIRDYVVSLVLATRGQHPGGPDLAKFLQFGASPRATINLTLAAKAWAFLQGRDHVTPQDVKDIAPDVLRHRLILTYEADAEGVDADAIVRRVLDAVSVP